MIFKHDPEPVDIPYYGPTCSLSDVRLVYIRDLYGNATGVRFSYQYWERVKIWQFWENMQLILLKIIRRKRKFTNAHSRR